MPKEKGSRRSGSRIGLDLDEQIQVRIHCVADVSCYTAEVYAFDDFFFFDAHDVHGHGAGDHFDAHFLRLGDHDRQGINVLLFHDGLDHFRAHAAHVHFRDRQLAGVVRQHDVEHFFHAAFGYADFFRTFDDVQIPESCHQSSFYSRLKKEVHTAVIVDIIVMRIVFWMIKLKITVASGEAGFAGENSSKTSPLRRCCGRRDALLWPKVARRG